MIKKWRNLSEKLYGLSAEFVYKQIKLTYGMLQVQQLCTDLPAFHNKKVWHFTFFDISEFKTAQKIYI